MDKWKFLVVGDYVSPIHEPAICKALEFNGIEVFKFQYSNYFRRNNFLFKKYYNLQKKILKGPQICQINRDLKRLVKKNHFDCIFFYRPTFIKKSTLLQSGKKSIVYFYNNDDPFSERYAKRNWKDYFAGLPYCKHIFYYREKNKQDYLNAGYNNISLLRSYFISSINYKLAAPKKYDVVFIGHYEEDGRDDWIKYILDQGINLKLFGPEWQKSRWFKYFQQKMGHITPLGKEYNLVINQAKIALVFLSKLNNDTYTRRCFEIPASGTFMLSQFSEDLAKMFIPGKEADYFTSKEELINKIKIYLSDNELRETIAAKGYDRVHNDAHEVKQRVKIILDRFYINKMSIYANS